MKRIIMPVLGALLLGVASPVNAQTVVQTTTFTLTAYDQSTPTTIKKIRITTKDVIRYFTGENTTGAQLVLATPLDSSPLTTKGNLNSSLQVTKNGNVLTEIPTPDNFNFFQDAVSSNTKGNTTSVSTDRISIDYGQFHVELQGLNTWTVARRGVFSPGGAFARPPADNGNSIPGTGSFSSTLSGYGTIDDVTQPSVPIQGTVTGGAPKLVE